eukprot:5252994-Alexandrium_andersonii.AAC.1
MQQDISSKPAEEQRKRRGAQHARSRNEAGERQQSRGIPGEEQQECIRHAVAAEQENSKSVAANSGVGMQ